MTAAEDRREELEAVIWRSLGRARAPLSVAWKQAHVAGILDAADAYAKASRPRGPKRALRPEKPRAVHFDAGSGGIACQPYGYRPQAATAWGLTADPREVTCGHCRKRPAWQKAHAACEPLPTPGGDL